MDDRFDYGELRVYAIGVVNGLEITLIYTKVIYTDVTPAERRIRAERHDRDAYRKIFG